MTTSSTTGGVGAITTPLLVAFTMMPLSLRASTMAYTTVPGSTLRVCSKSNDVASPTSTQSHTLVDPGVVPSAMR